jgi:putative metalloprotease
MMISNRNSASSQTSKCSPRKAQAAYALLSALLVSTGAYATDFGNLLGAVGDVAKAATVSDKDIADSSRQMMAFEDKKKDLAPASSKYAKRLATLTSAHTHEDGLNLNFKVYMSPTVNAFATPDGSVRVYSGLMDLMTDDELRGIIGHEIGHAKLGHSASAMKTALIASAARKAAASTDGVVGRLADSELGNLAEAVLNAQFSQSQETASDDYGFAFMQKHNYNVRGLETGFRKIAKLDGGGSHSAMSSHPDSGARADRVKQMADAKS